MTDADQAGVMNDKIEKMLEHLPEEGLGLDQEADAEFNTEFHKVVAEYEALENSVKDKVSTEKKEALTNVAKAFEMVEKYAQLNGIGDCVDTEDAEALGLKAKYEQIKSYMEAFKASSNREAVDEYIANNLKADYQKAKELFED